MRNSAELELREDEDLDDEDGGRGGKGEVAVGG